MSTCARKQNESGTFGSTFGRRDSPETCTGHPKSCIYTRGEVREWLNRAVSKTEKPRIRVEMLEPIQDIAPQLKPMSPAGLSSRGALRLSGQTRTLEDMKGH